METTTTLASFLTLNVNGLGNWQKRTRVFTSLESLGRDVCFIQETHINNTATADKIAKEWGGRSVWAISPHRASKGVAILFKKNSDVEIIKTEVDPDGRYCIAECRLHDSTFNLCNVYLPNDVTGRNLFLKKLDSKLNNKTNIVLGGDWNFVESHQLDRITTSQQSAGRDRTTRLLLGNIKLNHSLIDVFRILHPHKIEITFTSPANASSARLDRFYVNKLNKFKIKSTSLQYVTDCDHAAFTFNLLTKAAPHGPGYWKCNVSVLRDEHFRADLLALTARNNKLFKVEDGWGWWESCKREFRALIANHSHRLAANKKSKLNGLNKLIIKYTQQNATSPGAFDTLLGSLKAETKNILDSVNLGQAIRAKVTNLNQADNPALFAKIKEHSNVNKRSIHHLTVDGVDLHRQADIETACTNFYSSLLRREPIDSSLWQDLTADLVQINKADSELCESLITYEDCAKAINNMEDFKSPGCDGLPAEFYKYFFHLFGAHFVSILNSNINTLSLTQRTGIITLLCKDASKADNLGAWRPISLLNLDYKIISKVVLNKIKDTVGSIIGQHQTCGILGRSIFDNLHFLRNVFAYCKERQFNCIALCFDQAKAFDRVSHEYLFHILKKLGFGPQLIKYVSLLYTKIYSSVQVNGFLTDPFEVTRSMRQGCGLSPLLYAMCIEPLLVKINSNLLFKGIATPLGRSVEVRLAAHADDSTVLAADLVSVNIALETFQLYGKATGAMLNLDKSVACVISGHFNEQQWPKWLKKVDSVKICGVYFGNNADRINEETLINKVDSKISKLTKVAPSSLQGRVVVINTCILSLVWYLATVSLISNRTVLDLERKVFKFLWKGMEKVSRPTTTLPLERGGLGLQNIKLKCKTMRIKYLLQAYLKIDPARASFAKYWSNIALRKFFPSSWDNSSLHTINPDSYHREAIANFKIFKTYHKEEFNIKNSSKIVYGHLVQNEIAPPKVLEKPDHAKRAEAWKKLKKLPLSTEAKDLMWLIAHEALPIAAKIFTYHIVKHNLCTICYGETETISHCLFNCSQARPIWQLLYQLAPIIKNIPIEDLALLNLNIPEKNLNKYVSIMVSEACHTVWLARNKKVFDDELTPGKAIISKFKHKMALRIKSDFHRMPQCKFQDIWSNRQLPVIIDAESHTVKIQSY